MPTTPKALFRGLAPSTNGTIYTVPSSTTAVVTNVIVINPAGGSAGTFTIVIGGAPIALTSPIAAGQTLFFDMKQPIVAGSTISGVATSGLNIYFHISGVEIS